MEINVLCWNTKNANQFIYHLNLYQALSCKNASCLHDLFTSITNNNNNAMVYFKCQLVPRSFFSSLSPQYQTCTTLIINIIPLMVYVHIAYFEDYYKTVAQHLLKKRMLYSVWNAVSPHRYMCNILYSLYSNNQSIFHDSTETTV